MLELNLVYFGYDEKSVLDAVSFTVSKGQNISIIGESGCGKSTLLKLIYGLHDVNKGTITHDGKPILGPKFNLIPGAENIKYLAQDFDLMPFISVEENVGKFLSNVYKDKKAKRVKALLEMVEMTEFAKVKAKYLSGGQQQRVALARVLALEPELLLLDEPFSQIDTFRKNTLARNLFHYLKDKDITCIIATHDATEALSFSDETIVMKEGRIVAKNAPKNLFELPKDKYIASLFGEVNEIPVGFLKPYDNQNEIRLVYPYQLKLVKKSDLKVTIKQCYFKGNHFLVEAFFGNQTLFFENPSELDMGTNVYLGLIEQ